MKELNELDESFFIIARKAHNPDYQKKSEQLRGRELANKKVINRQSPIKELWKKLSPDTRLLFYSAIASLAIVTAIAIGVIHTNTKADMYKEYYDVDTYGVEHGTGYVDTRIPEDIPEIDNDEVWQRMGDNLKGKKNGN